MNCYVHCYVHCEVHELRVFVQQLPVNNKRKVK